MALPQTGDLDWGVPLNDYVVNTVQQMAQQALTNINTHNSATDPHGDRSFAQALSDQITNAKGAANGYAELGPDGKLKSTQAPAGGGRTNAYDVIKDFGAKANGSADDTAAIQSALDAVAAAGGGEVWFPNGIYPISSPLEIKAPGNVWIHLSNGAMLRRTATSPMTYMIRNFNSTSTYTGYTGPSNIIISGGVFDGNASNNATACTLICIAHADGVAIRETVIQNVTDLNAIHLNACRNIVVTSSMIRGLRVVGANAAKTAAIQIEGAINSTALPGIGSGSLDGTMCDSILVEGNTCRENGSLGSFGSIVGSNAQATGKRHTTIHVINNYGYKLNDYGVHAYGWQQFQVSGNTFVQCNGAVWWECPTTHTDDSDYNGIISNNICRFMGVKNNGSSVLPHVIAVTGVYGTGANPPSIPLREAMISGNQIRNYANTHGIYMLNTGDGEILNNTIKTGTGSGANGIRVDNSYAVRVVSNRVDDVTSAGIYIAALDSNNPASGCNHCILNSNYITSTGATGISVNYTNYATAVGNNFNQTTNAGVGIYNGSDYCLMAGNVGQSVDNGTQVVSGGAGTHNLNSSTKIG